MTTISTSPGIYTTQVKMLTREEEIELRDSDTVKAMVSAVRNGNLAEKKKLYYRVPQAMLPEGKDTVERSNNSLLNNGKVLLDYDLKGGGRSLFEKIKPHLEEYGVLHFELSVRYGAHLTVKQISGLTRVQTIMYFEDLLGVDFDPSYAALSQSTFLVPTKDVLFVSEDYWKTEVEPNKNLDTTQFLARIKAEEEEIKSIASQYSASKTSTPTDSVSFTSDSTMMEQDVEQVVSFLEQYHIDICPDYDTWIKVAFSLHDALGDAGFPYFERISALWSNGSNNPVYLAHKWEKTKEVRSITAATFFWLAGGGDTVALSASVNADNIVC